METFLFLDFWNELHNQYTSKFTYLMCIIFRTWSPKVIVYIKPERFCELENELASDERDGWNNLGYETRGALLNWCKESCQSKFKANNGFWWEFENEEDAALFILSWG